MRLGTLNWDEEVSSKLEHLPLGDEFIVVHSVWRWVEDLLLKEPTWFERVWSNNNEILYTTVDVYRAAGLYAKHIGFAEMTRHEFIQRSIPEAHRTPRPS